MHLITLVCFLLFLLPVVLPNDLEHVEHTLQQWLQNTATQQQGTFPAFVST